MLAASTSEVHMYRYAVVQNCSEDTPGSFRHIFATNRSQMVNLQTNTTQYRMQECTVEPVFFFVPFISRISRPRRLRENNGS